MKIDSGRWLWLRKIFTDDHKSERILTNKNKCMQIKNGIGLVKNNSS